MTVLGLRRILRCQQGEDTDDQIKQSPSGVASPGQYYQAMVRVHSMHSRDVIQEQTPHADWGSNSLLFRLIGNGAIGVQYGNGLYGRRSSNGAGQGRFMCEPDEEYAAQLIKRERH